MDVADDPRLAALHARLTGFLDEHLRPLEPALLRADLPGRRDLLAGVRAEARRRGLDNLAAPSALGGHGLPLPSYAHLAELEGRYVGGPDCLGSSHLLDLTTLDRHATAALRTRLLLAVASGETRLCYGMSEPDCSGSDLAAMRTTAVRDGDDWVIDGRKWFGKALDADWMTVFCRTAPAGVPHRDAFSMIVVPINAPGFSVVRELPVLGLHAGHAEVRLTGVRVPAANLLGAEGDGFGIALRRLALGRLLRSLTWVGQAGRAFELMCDRLRVRRTGSGMLGDKQLMQAHVFESWTAIGGVRQALHRAAALLYADDDRAGTEINAGKVLAARMFCDVTDRAIQVYGAEGLTDDTALSLLFREARTTRIYDGPDEVHIRTVARQVLENGLDRPVPPTLVLDRPPAGIGGVR